MLWFVPLATNHNAIAVAVRPWARHNGRNDRWVESADALEEVHHLFVLHPKLGVVRHVLVLAAATGGKMGTRWRDSFGRGLSNLHQAGSRVIPLNLEHFRLHDFTYQHERHEDDEVIHTAHSFAAKGDVLNGQYQPVTTSQYHARKLENSTPAAQAFSEDYIGLKEHR